MLRFFSVLALFCALLLRSALALPWYEQGNQRIWVFYHLGDDANVSAVLKAVNAALPDYEQRLGVNLKKPIQIYLTSSQEEFNQITGGRLPEWAQAVSLTESGVIILKSPRFSKDMRSTAGTALHELVHSLISAKVGSNMPRWLNEGLAQLLSGEGPEKNRLPLARAVWAGGILKLEAIENMDGYNRAEAELAYLESYNAAEFIVQRYGWERLRVYLQHLSRGSDWQDAFGQAFGQDFYSFHDLWVKQVRKSYRWMILLDVQMYVYLGMVLLVLAAGVGIYLKRRRTYQRWAEEEAELKEPEPPDTLPNP